MKVLRMMDLIAYSRGLTRNYGRRRAIYYFRHGLTQIRHWWISWTVNCRDDAGNSVPYPLRPTLFLNQVKKPPFVTVPSYHSY